MKFCIPSLTHLNMAISQVFHVCITSHNGRTHQPSGFLDKNTPKICAHQPPSTNWITIEVGPYLALVKRWSRFDWRPPPQKKKKKKKTCHLPQLPILSSTGSSSILPPGHLGFWQLSWWWSRDEVRSFWTWEAFQTISREGDGDEMTINIWYLYIHLLRDMQYDLISIALAMLF